MAKPMDMLCIYRVKPGKEEDFKHFLAKHWPTLHKAGLATDQPAKVSVGKTKEGASAFIEEFQWKDHTSPGVAHQTPEVMAVWEPMGALTTHMEFLNVTPVKL